MPVPTASFSHNGKFVPTVPALIAPGAEEYFACRLTEWLEGASLQSATWSISPSITIFFEYIDSVDSDAAVVGVSGFQADVDYTLTCTHTSDDTPPRRDSHSMKIRCRMK